MRAGAVLIIVIVFMAVTSSGASEMVAISSLFTFDVYRRYIDPKVRPDQALHACHFNLDARIFQCGRAWNLQYTIYCDMCSCYGPLMRDDMLRGALSLAAHAQASGGKLITVSRISVCVWAVIMGCAMSIAQAATINVNWLITIIGEPCLPQCRRGQSWRCCNVACTMLSQILPRDSHTCGSALVTVSGRDREQ